MDKRLVNGIAILATILWATSFVISAVNTDYSPPVSVHAVMMLVAGAAFSGSLLKKPESDEEKEVNKKKRKK